MVQKTTNRMTLSSISRNVLLMTVLFSTGNGFAQNGKYGATPEDSVQCVTNLSLYQEFYKQKSYDDALNPWRRVVALCPSSSLKMYVDGLTLRKSQIAKTKDETVKSALYDSLYMIYDQRIQYFGKKGYVLGRKGADMLRYTPERTEATYATLKESVEERQAKSEAGALASYYQAMYNMYQEGKVTKEQMLEEYLVVMGYIEANLTAASGEASEEGGDEGGNLYEKSRDIVNELFFKVADCADIGRIVGDLVKAKPDDIELQERLLKIMNSKDCTDEPSYLPLVKAVHQAKPSSESAYGLAMMLAKERDMNGALKYMKEAVDLCGDCTDRVKYLLKAGQVASASGSHGQARSYANQVLQIEPRNGEALMLVGNAISASSSGCSEPESWGPNWLAYDYYQRAKSLDPSVAEKASERMASCAARFPEQKDIFFREMKEGATVQVTCGGWNESTTVRARK